MNKTSFLSRKFQGRRWWPGIGIQAAEAGDVGAKSQKSESGYTAPLSHTYVTAGQRNLYN
jgi:hypothetical protein